MDFALISYIMSLVATVLGFIEPFSKKMKTVLLISLGVNLLFGLSYLLVGSYSGCITCATACVQLIINYTYNVRCKRLPWWLIAIYCLSFVMVNLFAFEHWYDVLAILASVSFALSISQTRTFVYRLLALLKYLLWVSYDLASASYGPLFSHIMLSVLFIYCIWLRGRKHQTD